jgi:hypothetical protein
MHLAARAEAEKLRCLGLGEAEVAERRRNRRLKSNSRAFPVDYHTSNNSHGRDQGTTTLPTIHTAAINSLTTSRLNKLLSGTINNEENGRATDAQWHAIEDLRAAGVHAEVAYGLDRALAVLEGWGILKGRTK